GYFSQRITEDGWQETRNMLLNHEELPVVRLKRPDGSPLMVGVTLAGRKVFARILQVQVGRIPLYLLDTDVDVNNPSDRSLTARLYSSDQEVRISQEILLGIGGARALHELGLNPTVFHMNEGHSAFLTVQRIRELVAAGVSYEEAKQQVKQTNVFTTHTPVPAGNDEFAVWLIDKYLPHVWQEMKIDRDQFVDLGRNYQNWGETFSMPVLALHLSEKSNAVSELHGQVSRKMWHKFYPDLKEDEVPIGHITNGVHAQTWMARRLRMLLDHYIGPDWADQIDDEEMWSAMENIPDGELWAVRRHLKNKLVSYASERVRKQWISGGFHPVQVVAGGVLLEPYSLTLGFARRFATYKRANLILRDVDRLIAMITDSTRPVQIIYAGKAHPSDEPGKMIIQQVYRAVKDSRSGGRLVFLEDYDMNLARYLVQGVDVWVNTPRRPNEASGTSGMKAAMNGTLNFSVLDGWWREGFNGKNGWAIGTDTDNPDTEAQDAADAESIYSTLENEIIPLYYNKQSVDGLPHGWIERIKESIRTLAPQFSTRRMLSEYMSQAYVPAMKAHDALKSSKK
ncbi:MAG: alpha-glucan family phosphorylase, partial [Anaerolineae bacterium]|nr:alpha-glucan family phosphorylase [Anaerolineae bacterium]